MSINDFGNKIKGKGTIDKVTIMYLFVVVGVGIACFGLGRLSVYTKFSLDNGIIFTNTPQLSVDNQEAYAYKAYTDNKVIPLIQERNYVASKNGKLYYSPSCSGAKRIKTENQIWFANSTDAEKLGYTLSTSCK
jgi:hypothetical protein